MTDVTIALSDDQIKSLLSLAADLRIFLDSARVRKYQRNQQLAQSNPTNDPWFDDLKDVKGDRVSTLEVFHRYLGRELAGLTPKDGQRLAAIMRRLGWDGPKSLRFGDRIIRGYTRFETVFTKT